MSINPREVYNLLGTAVVMLVLTAILVGIDRLFF